MVCDACKWLVGGLCSRAASGGCWKGCTFLCTRIPHPIGAVTCLGICLTACGFLLAYETSTWLLKKFAGGPIYVENIVFLLEFFNHSFYFTCLYLRRTVGGILQNNFSLCYIQFRTIFSSFVEQDNSKSGGGTEAIFRFITSLQSSL